MTRLSRRMQDARYPARGTFPWVALQLIMHVLNHFQQMDPLHELIAVSLR